MEDVLPGPTLADRRRTFPSLCAIRLPRLRWIARMRDKSSQKKERAVTKAVITLLFLTETAMALPPAAHAVSAAGTAQAKAVTQMTGSSN